MTTATTLPRWWAAFRTVVTFLLGVAVILDSLVEKNTATVGKLVVGLLLVGVPPIEDLIRLVTHRPGSVGATQSTSTRTTDE
jgi:hypothetical protein